VRTGGFGGADGLAAYLREDGIALLVDATHPFAVTISGHARRAAEAAAVPRLAVVRPPWRAAAGDCWIEAPDAAAAARQVARIGRRAFLTVGARELGAFAGLDGIRFVVRLIEPPRAELPLGDAVVIVARPPFTLDGERDLLHRHAIEVVVAKASGGALPAKFLAAREAGIPVVMVKRPPPEPGPSVASAAEAVAWIADRLG